MIVNEKTDKFKECSCGHKPVEYSIGYGRTPYNMMCKCGKQLNDAKCEITGSVKNLFDYWNKKLRHMTLEEIKEEKKSFIDEKNKVEAENFQKARKYVYFWTRSKGEELIQSW